MPFIHPGGIYWWVACWVRGGQSHLVIVHLLLSPPPPRDDAPTHPLTSVLQVACLQRHAPDPHIVLIPVVVAAAIPQSLRCERGEEGVYSIVFLVSVFL